MRTLFKGSREGGVRLIRTGLCRMSIGLVATFWLALSPAHAQFQESECAALLNGKIAWDQNGSKTWLPGNAANLCRFTADPNATIRCFSDFIGRGILWPVAIKECRSAPVVQIRNLWRSTVVGNKNGQAIAQPVDDGRSFAFRLHESGTEGEYRIELLEPEPERDLTMSTNASATAPAVPDYRGSGLFMQDKGGLVVFDSIDPGLVSIWQFEPLDGHQLYRLQNRLTGRYLHVEYGRLESGGAEPGWHSAMWIVRAAGSADAVKRSVRLF